MFGAERSDLDKGLDAFNGRHWRKARRLLEDAIAADHPRAIADYHLGLLYWRGLGGDQDVGAGVECFRRAAESGHAAAQTALAMALQSGVGAQRDLAQARMLFRSAAGAGDLDAMVQLALISDRAEARRLLERASDAGHVAAMRHLSDLLIEDDAEEALALLYANVALSGNHAVARHAEALAREMTAAEIDAAQKRGRAILKKLRHEKAR
ncbi:MAG: hypothetical protein ABUL42_04100 [Terricaulis silvestris]